MSKVFIGIMGLLFISLLSTINNPLKENNIVKFAIEAVKIQAGLPQEVEIKFVEKRESAIPDFYMIKLLIMDTGEETPVVVYVDKACEKVILGTLLIRGENITFKEGGGSKTPKINAMPLEVEKATLFY
ncbi:MAG TPA: hypothetical protein VK551_07280 [Thermodesulfobacteriota bacterium]|nr:hypothetical protein [Thermodesulfobacteriota bacterium]